MTEDINHTLDARRATRDAERQAETFAGLFQALWLLQIAMAKTIITSLAALVESAEKNIERY